MNEDHAGRAAALGAAKFLALAAAPAFAGMALLTSLHGAGASDVICAASHGPLGGMAPMYALMSAVHLPPWLKLASNRPLTAPASRSPWRPWRGSR